MTSPPAPTPTTRTPKAGKRLARRTAVIVATATALFVAGGLGIGLAAGPDDSTTSAGSAPAAVNFAGGPAAAGAPGSIEALQQRLADAPDDDRAWAALGAAYVEAARATADPAFYPKAEGAFARSLQAEPEDNLAAMVGMGALANARHDFAGALRWGKKATAVSDFNPDAYGVLTDAYTQLGMPAKASAAAQRMLDLLPTLPALARGSYDLEQRGEVDAARTLLEQALKQSLTPADIGFCRYYLGELAFHAGDLAAAADHYEQGLVANPTSAPLLQGRAKVAALRGDSAAAIRDYAELVSRVPNPQYIVEYAEVLAKFDRPAEAKEQLALVEAVHSLFAANGGQDDLALAEYEADHGSAEAAVERAEAEWAKRKSAVVADAMAWALHQAGRDDEALRFADKALARGWRNALFFHHRSEIHRALGDREAAAADAARVERHNPRFDPELPSFGRST